MATIISCSIMPMLISVPHLPAQAKTGGGKSFVVVLGRVGREMSVVRRVERRALFNIWQLT